MFTTALDALNTAIDSQRELQTSEFLKNSEVSVRARMGLHTGEAELRDGDYFGQAFNRAARVMSAGHGGQILISDVAAQVVRLLGTSDAIKRSTFMYFYPFEIRELDAFIAKARAQLGDEAFEKAWAEGAAMSVEEAIRYALEAE